MTTPLSSQTEAESVSATRREPPAILPANAVVDYNGFGYKTVIFQWPDGLTLQDLNDAPEKVWKRVQIDRSGKALCEWDAVELRGRDFMVTARVNWAGADRVVLFAIQRHSKPPREIPLYSDDLYEVFWAPEGGFSYRRKRDGVRMNPATWPTPESARHELLSREYPKTVGAQVVG